MDLRIRSEKSWSGILTEALYAGVPQRDISLSRLCWIDARDVRTFRECSAKGFLIVVRCPKVAARAWHGLIPPKPISVKSKSGSSGVAVKESGDILVSDYDLMSVWRREGMGWRKVFLSAANGAPHGRYPEEGTALLKELNRTLISRIQHGCQDDYYSPKNPGVNMTDHFAIFCNGIAEHHPNAVACKAFYERNKLVWLYATTGAYLINVANVI